MDDTVSGPDGKVPERDAYSDTILARRLREAMARLNPQTPEDAREDAMRWLVAPGRPSLIEENRRLHRALVEGVPVEFRAEDGTRPRPGSPRSSEATISSTPCAAPWTAP